MAKQRTFEDHTFADAPETMSEAIRDCLSPEAVAMLAAYLQPAVFSRVPEHAREAACQVEWFHDLLVEVLGVDEFNRLMDEIGL